MKLFATTLCLAVLFVSSPALFAQGSPAASPGTAAQFAPAQPVRLKSPEIGSDRKVTFRLKAPDAAKVTLNGSWIGAVDLPMTKDDAGVWSATIGPMTPQM